MSLRPGRDQGPSGTHSHRPARGPILLASILALPLPQGAFAATGMAGAEMGWPWALPFVGTLLSIALGPLLCPAIWHRHYGKIIAGWALASLLPTAVVYGGSAMVATLVHALLGEYLSFIIVLLALYTIAGGILVQGTMRSTPEANTAMLALGTCIASIVGTTGAAMILLRPLIRANKCRKHVTHVFVFFIILVANVGGALSPLGDPPLFAGFLRGVDFFWPARNLWMQTTIVAGVLLLVFFAVDTWFARSESATAAAVREPIRIRGWINLVLLFLAIGSVVLSANWQPNVVFEIHGTEIALQNLVRDASLAIIAILSLTMTRVEHRAENGFTWGPIVEVAKLFAGIFVTIGPVLAMLHAGSAGPFAWLLGAVTSRDGLPQEAAYFWLTGLLSAFLDNAPTYVVFFELAGGDAKTLMGPLSGTLAALSMGAVYMGALTYVGNAPNLMVRAIAEENGIRMPGFFAYMGWAALILLPLFVLLTLLPISPLLKLR